MKFSYPIESNSSKSKENENIDSLEAFYKNRKSTGGYYPIGKSHLWHGGVHIDTGNAAVCCMADGYIVAYRMPEKYIDNGKIIYSNGFVLVQHQYKSPKEQELTFYTLYMHLLPKDEYKETNKKPFFLTKNKYKVKAKLVEKDITGLALYINNTNKKDSSLHMVPKGTKIEIVEETPVFSTGSGYDADMKYRKVAYQVWNEPKIEGYMATYLKKKSLWTDTNIVNHNGTGKPYSGALVYEKEDDTSAILDIIPKETEIEGTKNGKFIEVQSPNCTQKGYVKEEQLDIETEWDVTCNEVVSCKIKVTAGTPLGYGGMYGKRQIVHLEVFTAESKENLEAFIKNEKEDGIEGENKEKITNLHTLLPKEIKKAFKCKLLGDTQIMVVGEKGDYYCIEIGTVNRTVDKSEIGSFSGWDKKPKPGYPAKPGTTLFEGFAKEGDFFEILETQKDVDNKKKIGDTTSRKVGYSYPNITGKTFWIAKKDIDKIEIEIPVDRLLPVLDPWIYHEATKNQAPTLSLQQKRKETHYRLHSNSTFTGTAAIEQELYLYNPTLWGAKDTTLEETDSIAVQLSNDNKITQVNDKPWYYISTGKHNENGKPQLINGYIQPEKCFPPQNWDKFGFKISQSESDKDKYLMDFGSASPLLQEVWTVIDADGDGELEDWEFDSRMTNPYYASKISRYIYYHRSEWAYCPGDGLDEELENELCQAFDKRIGELAKNDNMKKLMEAERDQKIEQVTCMAGELSFWNKIQIDANDKELKAFPTSSDVFHFHPIAFVEQMMKVNTGDCGGRYCITKENYKEKKAEKLVQELNIRLAGFGGNVPSEEFTTRTENMIKQFQRDYMKVPETGKICGGLLSAVDEFCSKSEYNFNFEQTKCTCASGKYKSPNKDLPLCSGYGNNKTGHTIDNKWKAGVEYGGTHRSLLFALKGLMFYMQGSVYSLNCIYSAYRCWVDNVRHSRTSSNHMGCAFDIHINKNGVRTSSVEDMEKIRKDYLCKYMNAPEGYDKNVKTYYFGWLKNYIGLEPKKFRNGESGATSWVHIDVREFEAKYKDSKFFVKNISDMNGKLIVDLAKELGLVGMCNCKGSSSATNTTNNNDTRVDPKTLKISQKGIDFIKSWEAFRAKAYNDSKGYCTIGYGHLIDYKKCEDMVLPDEFKNGITQEKANELFNERLPQFENAVKRDVTVPLYQYEYDALVSLLFNCGPNFLKDGKAPKLYKNLLDKKYNEAADEFADIIKGGAGLKERRQDEINIFKNNTYKNHN
jgi:GH24 family phage-related lysozyme (muramidase)